MTAKREARKTAAIRTVKKPRPAPCGTASAFRRCCRMADTEPPQDPTLAENLERARRYQRVLLALGRELTADCTFTEFLQRTCEQIAHATRIGRSKIARYRPREGD